MQNYGQYNTVVDGNIIYQRSSNGTHCDNIQTYNFTNFTAKNNYIESFGGWGDNTSQTALLEDMDGTVYVYNNVIR